MTSRYNKPGANKHGITDTRTLKLLSRQKTKGKDKCETCDKVVYESMMEAHEAAIAYNTAFVLTGPLKKRAYECRESPGNYHFGAITPKGMSEPTPIVPDVPTIEAFVPPPMPVVEEYVHKPVMHPVKIVQEADHSMDEIVLNGITYIKKSLVPLPPKIEGTINMAGKLYYIIKK